MDFETWWYTREKDFGNLEFIPRSVALVAWDAATESELQRCIDAIEKAYNEGSFSNASELKVLIYENMGVPE
jgi:hypothetical protein